METEQLSADELTAQAHRAGLKLVKLKKLAPSRGGRPKSMTKARQKQALALREEGETTSTICKMIGVSERTLRRFRSKESEFKVEWERAGLARIEHVADTLYSSALAGDVKAMIFWLVNHTRFLPADHPLKYQHVGKVFHEMRTQADIDGETSTDEKDLMEEAQIIAEVERIMRETDERAQRAGASDPSVTDTEAASE